MRVIEPMFKNLLRFRRMKYRHHGHIEICGIDYGPKGLKEVKDLGEGYAIWKSFGYSSWSGIGTTSYYAPDYFLVRVEENTVRMLARVDEPGHKWRDAIKLLETEYKKRFDEIADSPHR